MAENIENLDISKTFSNVLLCDVQTSGGSDVLGIPVSLSTVPRRTSARVQDGIGNSSPLLVSETEIAVDQPPLSVDGVARLAEMLEAFAQSQNNQLIL